MLKKEMDGKIVALNVELRDHRLAKIAQGIALGELQGEMEIAAAMAREGVPFIHWRVFEAGDDLDAYVHSLRRLAPVRCGLVDLPSQTAVCARAVVNFNQVPTGSGVGDSVRIQGAAQGSALVEEIALLEPGGEVRSVAFERKDKNFEASLSPRTEGLHTVEVLARTGRGVEPVARWWLRVGASELPGEPEPVEPEPGQDAEALARQAFSQLNADRAEQGVDRINRSNVLTARAVKRAVELAKQGALSPPDPEVLAKLRIENERAISNYKEVLVEETDLAAVNLELLRSPSKRRMHLDRTVNCGGIGIAQDAAGGIYMVEVLGRAYDPNNAGELRRAVVEHINLLRARKSAPALKEHKPLQRYAQKLADENLRRGDFLEKDDMGRSVSDAILGDVDGLQFAGSEMFKVSGAEEVTPGATPTDKRFSLVGVGAARKTSDLWWVVILVALADGK